MNANDPMSNRGVSDVGGVGSELSCRVTQSLLL